MNFCNISEGSTYSAPPDNLAANISATCSESFLLTLFGCSGMRLGSFFAFFCFFGISLAWVFSLVWPLDETTCF